MNRVRLWLFLGLLFVAFPGCVSRALDEGIGYIKGVSGACTPLVEIQEELDSYERFEMEEFEDDFGGMIPPEFWSFLGEEFEDALSDDNIPNASSGRTLLIRGKVVHIETRGITGVLLGDFEEVVARVELVDKGTGDVLGVANCIGRSNDSVNRGLRKKAEGLAEAIVSWIDDSYPEE